MQEVLDSEVMPDRQKILYFKLDSAISVSTFSATSLLSRPDIVFPLCHKQSLSSINIFIQHSYLPLLPVRWSPFLEPTVLEEKQGHVDLLWRVGGGIKRLFWTCIDLTQILLIYIYFTVINFIYLMLCLSYICLTLSDHSFFFFFFFKAGYVRNIL